MALKRRLPFYWYRSVCFFLTIVLCTLSYAQYPGNISSEIQLWVKANEGVLNNGAASVDGGAVDEWVDQSGARTNNLESDPSILLETPTFANNGANYINYNPVVSFDGYDDGLGLGTDYIFADNTKSGMSWFTVVKPNLTTGNNHQYIFDQGYSHDNGFGLIYGDDYYEFYAQNNIISSNANTDNTNTALISAEYDFGVEISIETNGDISTEITGGLPLTELTTTNIYIEPDRGYYTVFGFPQYSDTYGGGFIVGQQSKGQNLNGNPRRYFNGYIAELIGYSADLTDIEEQKIESYLAIKYGVTLQKNYLSADGDVIFDITGYGTDVIGVGRDDAQELLQLQSQSVDNTSRIYLGNLENSNLDNTSADFDTDNSYLVFSHDGGVTDTVNTEIPGSVSAKLDREWKYTNTGFDATVSIELNLPDFSGANQTIQNDALLLIDDDGDFSDATVISNGSLGLSFTYVGGVLTLEDLPTSIFPEDATTYFTFGLPGGCSPPDSAVLDMQGVLYSCGNTFNYFKANLVPGYSYTWYEGNNPMGPFSDMIEGDSIALNSAFVLDVSVRIAHPSAGGDPACYLQSNVVSVLSTDIPDIAINTINNPSACDVSDGSFIIENLRSGQSYVLSYDTNGTTVNIPFVSTATTYALSGLAAGDYDNIHVSVDSCSTNSINITLEEPDAPTLTATLVQPTCGQADGSIELDGFTSGLTYSLFFDSSSVTNSSLITPTSSTYTISNLPGGVYDSVYVTIVGCSSNVLTETLTEESPPTANIGSVTNPTACNGTDGTIEVAGLQAGESYTMYYDKNNVTVSEDFNAISSTSITLINLSSGLYENIQVALGNCRSAYLSDQTLTDPVGEAISVSSVNPSNCGVADGSLVIDGLNPGESYTAYFDSSGVLTSSDFTSISGTSISIVGLDEGIYDSIFVSGGGCLSNVISGISLSNPNSPDPALFDRQNPSQCGANDGEILIDNLIPNTSYEVSYSVNGNLPLEPSSFSADVSGIIYLSGLIESSYSEISVSLNGCEGKLDSIIVLSDPLGVSLTSSSISPTTCAGNDGEVYLEGLDDAVIYEIYYTVGGIEEELNGVVPSSGAFSITGLSADSIQDIYAIGNGCFSDTVHEVLTDPEPPVFTSSTQDVSSCNGSDGGILLSGLDDLLSYDVFYNGQLQVINQIPTSGSLMIAGLDSGVYYDFHIEALACKSDSVNIEISEPESDSIFVVSATNPTGCGSTDGAIVLGGLSSGENYILSYTSNSGVVNQSFVSTSSTLNLSDLGSGAYSSIRVERNSCISNQINHSLNDPGSIVLGVAKDADPTWCGSNDGQILLSGFDETRSYTLSYDSLGLAGTRTFSGVNNYVLSSLIKGEYSSWEVIDNGNCSSSVSTEVQLLGQDYSNSSSVITDESNCDATVWSTGNLLISNTHFLPNTEYQYAYNGNALSAVFTNGVGQISLDLDEGLYSDFSIVDSVNCAYSLIDQTVGAPTKTTPLISLNIPDEVCVSDTVSLFANVTNEGISPAYRWYRNNTLMVTTDTNVLLSNEFENNDLVRVHLVVAEDCVTDQEIESSDVVVSLQAYNASINQPIAVGCEGENILISASGSAGSYVWSANGEILSTTSTVESSQFEDGDLLTMVFEPSGVCVGNMVTETVTLSVYSVENIGSPIAEREFLCQRDSVLLSLDAYDLVGELGSILWYKDGELIDSATSIWAISEGDYHYKIITKEGCEASSEGFFIEEINVNAMIQPSKLEVRQGEDLELIADSLNPGSSYSWYSRYEGDSYTGTDWTVFPEIDDQYILVETNEGCADRDTVEVLVQRDFRLPIIFTPNGDGINDIWDIIGLENEDQAFVQVFNRWGLPVFISRGYSTPWDGRHLGMQVPDGVYYYLIERESGEEIHGEVTIIR